MNNKTLVFLNATSSMIWAIVAISNLFNNNIGLACINLLACVLHGLTAGIYFKNYNGEKSAKLDKEKNTAQIVELAKPKEKVFDFTR